MNLPAGLAAGAADFMADHVFSRIDIPSWLARTGFQMLDPIKTAQSRLDFLRQLHDREALLPREQQRRFLASEGWIAWSGPAIAELLKQFIAHNRMMTGGFAIHGELVTLNDINCPVLAVVGEVDDIGQPASVRGIKRAAPQADVYEYLIRAGHFGLVVGSKAATQTWPTVAQWVKSIDGDADLPDGVTPMALQPAEHSESGVPLASRLAHGATAAGEMAFTLARSAADAVVAANKSARALAVETVRTLPRLARLGQINDHTRISLGRIMSEQARGAPNGECLLFDGRVHTYEAVDRRINNVVRGLIDVGVRQGAHVGVLMETRPSALVAIAALSRLGAVAVLMPPDADLATVVRLGAVSDIIADPSNLEAARGLSMRVLVLGGGESRDLHLPDDADVVDMEQIDPDEVDLPGWYRPNPGLARDLAFVAFSTVGGQTAGPADHQLPLGAVRVRHRVGGQPRPQRHGLLPHPAAPPVRAAGEPGRRGRRRLADRAVARPGVRPLRAGDPPVRRDRGVLHLGDAARGDRRSVVRADAATTRCGCSSARACRPDCGNAWSTSSAPAHVVEFFATTDGQAVLANVSGAKIGSKGRPLPGGGEVELAAYDAEDDLILEDDRGFVRKADTNEVGVMLAHPRGPIDPTASVKRGVFAPADTWVSTEYLFRRDQDGDYWLVDNRSLVIRAERGPVYASPVNDAVGGIDAVDMSVTYAVDVRRAAGRGDRPCAAPRRQRRGGRPIGGAGGSSGRSGARTSCMWCPRWRSARLIDR